MNRIVVSTASVLALSLLSSLGCERHARTTTGEVPSTIDIEMANRNVLAGDTVTLIARTKETYGRDARIEWSTTGGSLKTEDNGRVARVRFETPGTYGVSAKLQVEGRQVAADMVDVRVNPVN